MEVLAKGRQDPRTLRNVGVKLRMGYQGRDSHQNQENKWRTITLIASSETHFLVLTSWCSPSLESEMP